MKSERRGRPRRYDPDKAVQDATHAFWDFGYEGASMDILSTAMSMNRPSLYGAFGDKHALYMRTLERYRAFSRGTAAEILAADGLIADALAGIYRNAIDIYLAGDQSARGCFLIGTAVSEAVQDHEIRAALAAGLHELDDLIEARLQRAVADGEMSGTIAPPILAKLVCGIMNALAIRARAGDPRADLEAIADAAVALFVTR